MSPPSRVVICGGGIIGSCTAYYLTQLAAASQLEVLVTLVERDSLAGQASGKAGGFLARDWCNHGPVGPLARKSFQLHEELAMELAPVDIGYRKLDALSAEASARGQRRGRVKATGIPDWLDGAVTASSEIGSQASTAQVHPYLLTNALVDRAKEKGAEVLIGTVQKVVFDERDQRRVCGVLVDGKLVPADAVVIAMGPWSGQAADWFPKLGSSGWPKISGSRAHSIVLDAKDLDITPHAIFLSYDGQDPEIYPRPDGTVYVCGSGDQSALPASPSEVSVDEKSCDNLHAVAGSVSARLKTARRLKSQACYMPSAPRELPVIGRVPAPYEGAFVAAGHTCWGILNGPATGLAMAELILKGDAKSVSLEAFDPGRFN